MTIAYEDLAGNTARRLSMVLCEKHGLSLPSEFVNELDDAVAAAMMSFLRTGASDIRERAKGELYRRRDEAESHGNIIASEVYREAAETVGALSLVAQQQA